MPSASDGGPRAPERIGPYRIVGVLGEGGMGVVYRAEQTEPVRRTVALKLIRGGADFADVVARFEAERQALAVMEHPRIAKVLDAGTAEDGSPYFVMEYVAGTPIDEYCDAHRLDVRERLGLFTEACDAVEHAHRKGIIHRDLKPSNVLVTEQAGAPHPMVIDFGIAKAAGVRLTERTLATAHGEMVGTPAYMAPEQAHGGALDVDTRADVYALGVMLYQLLVGELPLDPDRMGFVQFLARLLASETPPPTPSARLVEGDTAPAVADLRRTTPTDLGRRLEGDLDWIVMKAIETDLDRRYGTAAELAEDIGRHLADEPVSARPPSAAYRLRKFARRNRAGVLAAVAAVVVLVAGAVASTTGFLRATRAEARAVAESDRAAEEAATATEVTDFLVGLFGAADPGQSGSAETTAREVLDAGVDRIGEELAGQPLIQSRLLSTMSGAYEGIGQQRIADDLLRRALPLVEEARGPLHPDVAVVLEQLLDLQQFSIFASSHPFFTDPAFREEMLGWARRAVEIREANLEADTLAWVGAVGRRANLLGTAGRMVDAEALLTSAVSRIERGDGAPREGAIRLQDDLARIYVNAGRGREAAEQWEQVLAARKAQPGADPEAIMVLTHNLAFAYDALGDTDRALARLEEALEMAKALVGDDPRERLRLQPNYFNLAVSYSDAGRPADAARTWDELAAIYRPAYGNDHQYPMGWQAMGAREWIAAGQRQRGIEQLRPAMAALVRDYESGEAEPGVMNTLIRGFEGWAAAAVAAGQDPVPGLLELAGSRPELRADALTALGHVYARDIRSPNTGEVLPWIEARYESRPEDALAAFERALDYTDEERWDDRGEWHQRIRNAHFEVAIALLRLGRGADVAALAPRWLAAVRTVDPGDGSAVDGARRDIAGLLYRGLPDRDVEPVASARALALPFVEQVVVDQERAGRDDASLVADLLRLRAALIAAGREAEATRVQGRIRDLLEARIEELEGMAAAGELVDAQRWNGSCWNAALAGLPETALRACDAAVEGAYGLPRGNNQDSRGVARALSGDFEGAIADFEAFIAWRPPWDRGARMRQAWVDALKRGEDPFTPDVLGALAF